MQTFYHNASGITGQISVSGPHGSYSDTVENFEQDYGGKIPPMEEGVRDQLYEPGIRHAYHDEKGSVIGGGDLDWPAGNRIIRDLPLIIQEKKKRLAKDQAFDDMHWEATNENQQFDAQKKAEAERPEKEAALEAARKKDDEELNRKIRQVISDMLADGTLAAGNKQSAEKTG